VRSTGRFVARPVFLNIEPGAKAASRAAQDHDAHFGAVGEPAEIGVEFVDQPSFSALSRSGRLSVAISTAPRLSISNSLTASARRRW
jgi:hypothetical protein